jgi:hypothetical protein
MAGKTHLLQMGFSANDLFCFCEDRFLIFCAGPTERRPPFSQATEWTTPEKIVVGI